MSEMTERLVTALMESDIKFPCFDEATPLFREEAEAIVRVVLSAMREPTADMKAIEDVHWDYNCHVCGGLAHGWRKMIDEALKP
jgi:hypothetical protein